MPISLDFTGLRITDLIRQVLADAGASATDLATYDALPVGGVMTLTTSVTSQAFQQNVRAKALATLSGAYRINGADSALDTASTNTSTNSISVSMVAGATYLQANTLPVFAFLNTGGNALGGTFSMRRSTTAYITTSLLTAGTVFDTNVFPAATYAGAANQYLVFVCKRPTGAATIDTNVTGSFTGGIGLNTIGTNDYIATGGAAQTSFTSTNSFHRQYQAIAAPVSNW